GGRAVSAPLPAGTRRDREGRVAEPYDHMLQRHAQHFGRGLADDRVAAGADVSHVGLDRHDAAIVEPDARGRLGDLVVAKCGRHAHADQPTSLARLARPSRAPVPTESLGASAEALDQLTLRKGVARRRRTYFGFLDSLRIVRGRTAGIIGHDLGIVEDAELDRIEAELLG